MLENPQQPPSDNSSLSSLFVNNFIFVIFWLFYLAYTYLLLFSPPNQPVPGFPIWAIQPETIIEIMNESLNFFFILPFLNMGGLGGLISPLVPPVSEAIFNFAEAWIFMFLPLLLADVRGRHLPRFFFWICAMFLTNVFLIPYMILRLKTPRKKDIIDQSSWVLSRSFGTVSLLVGITATIWFFVGRPEWGNLAVRLDYLIDQFTNNRVIIAFTVDLVLFWLFQSILLGDIIEENQSRKWLRFLPFFGLAFWLIGQSSQTSK
ncbi:MAG TPA: hypothetical protein DCF68_12930 [Cyanothece sp. UBA12306]|nr:hypothetical protein [Cyanothece sp. UBA12306]